LISIRPLLRADVRPLEGILVRTGVFTEEEIQTALELMDIYLDEPNQRDYELSSALDGETVVGYVCFGPTPLTEGTFDLYWIAVDPARYHQKIGRQLMTFAEDVIRSRRGRLIVLETSSQPRYDNTRKFYLGLKYTELARIRGYYRNDDDLVIYGKYL